MDNKDKSSLVVLPQFPRQWTVSLVIYHTVLALLSWTVLRAMWNCPDKERAMAVYGAYHREPWNQVIHFFGIPALVFTLFIFFALVPLTDALVLHMPGSPRHYPTWTTLWYLAYNIFYVRIDGWGALVMAPVLYGMYTTAVRWVEQDQRAAWRETGTVNRLGTGRLLQRMVIVHMVSWYMQIHWGHAVAEGGKPALMDGLGEALSSAPLFALYEGLWAVGWRPAFRATVRELVDKHVQSLCAAGSQMRACQTLK
jgi:2-hydroxy fatty acid dioxygenase